MDPFSVQSHRSSSLRHCRALLLPFIFFCLVKADPKTQPHKPAKGIHVPLIKVRSSREYFPQHLCHLQTAKPSAFISNSYQFKGALSPAPLPVAEPGTRVHLWTNLAHSWRETHPALALSLGFRTCTPHRASGLLRLEGSCGLVCIAWSNGRQKICGKIGKSQKKMSRFLNSVTASCLWRCHVAHVQHARSCHLSVERWVPASSRINRLIFDRQVDFSAQNTALTSNISYIIFIQTLRQGLLRHCTALFSFDSCPGERASVQQK